MASLLLRAEMSFEQVDGGTRIAERIIIGAPRPLAAVMGRKAMKARVGLLAGIRRCLD